MSLRHAQPVTVESLDATRLKRRRAAVAAEWPGKPLSLSQEERELLTDWAAGSTALRRWDALWKQAGRDRLELADRLAERLLAWGVWTERQQFVRSRWERHEIAWTDLAVLQRELGLATDADRQDERQRIEADLAALFDDELVGEAAAEVLESRLALKLKRARTELLAGLSSWHGTQRSGLRQDFALHARPHTKAITAGEWSWLDERFDLASRGVGRLMPMLSLAGDARLSWAGRHVSLAAVPLMALPSESILNMEAVEPAPQRYWLVENRASFEKQALVRPAGCCLIWTAGRPGHAWLAAVRTLLARAPAPAWVSADADPAGIEIALAAAAPWADAGLDWQPHGMEPDRLKQSKRLPLNGYDQACLARLAGRDDLPQPLAELAEALRALGGKAEQEGWL